MNALQEEITQKTLALCVEASKMTAQLLQQAMKKVLADMEKHKKNPQLRHGKQTLRQLMPVCLLAHEEKGSISNTFYHAKREYSFSVRLIGCTPAFSFVSN